VTPTTSVLLFSRHFLDPFWKLRSLRKENKGIDINTQDETFYTTQYQKVFLKYAENEYSAKHRCLAIFKSESVSSNNLFASTTAS